MKKVLFINPGQIKSVTDNYNYYLNICNNYNLTYIGIREGDYNVYDNINIIYLDKKSCQLLSKINFISEVIKLLNKNNFDFIFVNYFFLASILKICTNKKINVDIRTSYISNSILKRFFFNQVLKFEVKAFNSITCISESLKNHLKLPSKTIILPLGANIISERKKFFNEMNLLYVGTLHERNLEKTVVGLSYFVNKFPKCNIQYTIIGTGSKEDTELLIKLIKKFNLNSIVTFLGEIRYPEVTKYFESNNIGVSFIPITIFFDNQPPTKTFEYLLSGMAVIATNTKENNRIINYSNGVLISDTAESFSSGLEHLYHNFKKFNSCKIIDDAKSHTWKNIIDKVLINLIEKNQF